mmetsp:Transcript_23706/g.33138  ORF Transcript_23706/g.33138 Transcript_23706/m.33138 type:complete len:204 (+) Transcript_23706:736-1347(+)
MMLLTLRLLLLTLFPPKPFMLFKDGEVFISFMLGLFLLIARIRIAVAVERDMVKLLMNDLVWLLWFLDTIATCRSSLRDAITRVTCILRPCSERQQLKAFRANLRYRLYISANGIQVCQMMNIGNSTRENSFHLSAAWSSKLSHHPISEYTTSMIVVTMLYKFKMITRNPTITERSSSLLSLTLAFSTIGSQKMRIWRSAGRS